MLSDIGGFPRYYSVSQVHLCAEAKETARGVYPHMKRVIIAYYSDPNRQDDISIDNPDSPILLLSLYRIVP